VESLEEGQPVFFVLPRGKSYGFPYFVIQQGDDIRAYMDRCPHQGRPLGQGNRPANFDGSKLTCGYHGAVFEISSGVCIDGPCKTAKLPEIPIKIEDGLVVVTE
jgi:nitrite reductase/ring-hydroxylating ferredoxin subunit